MELLRLFWIRNYFTMINLPFQLFFWLCHASLKSWAYCITWKWEQKLQKTLLQRNISTHTQKFRLRVDLKDNSMYFYSCISCFPRILIYDLEIFWVNSSIFWTAWCFESWSVKVISEIFYGEIFLNLEFPPGRLIHSILSCWCSLPAWLIKTGN